MSKQQGLHQGFQNSDEGLAKRVILQFQESRTSF
jgi:hypothetical protein